MTSIELIQELIFSVAISLFLVYLSQIHRFSWFLSSLSFILLLLGVNFIPLYRGSSLIELIRGAVGDVSTASGALLILIIFNQFDFSESKQAVLNWPEKLGLILLGGILYLSTFGFIEFDLYHLGYLSPKMLLLFSSITCGLIVLKRRLGYVWLFAIISFYFKLQASNNLWDYLYDPLLCIVLIANALLLLLRKKPKKHWELYH
jgi:hypothetical protein